MLGRRFQYQASALATVLMSVCYSCDSGDLNCYFPLFVCLFQGVYQDVGDAGFVYGPILGV